MPPAATATKDPLGLRPDPLGLRRQGSAAKSAPDDPLGLRPKSDPLGLRSGPADPSREAIFPEADRPTPERKAARLIADIDEAAAASGGGLAKTAQGLALPMFGMDLDRFAAGVDRIFKGNEMEERAAGARVAGEELAAPLLTGLGAVVGGGAAGAARAGGAKALGKYAGTMAAEVGVGTAAEEAGYHTLKALGVPEHTARVAAATLTLPVGVDMARRGLSAARGVKPEIHSVTGGGPPPATKPARSVEDFLGATDPPGPHADTPLDGAAGLRRRDGKPVEFAVAGGRPEGEALETVPFEQARAERVAAIDGELNKLTEELFEATRGAPEGPPQNLIDAYQERANALVAQREAALAETPAEPAPLRAGSGPPPPMGVDPEKIGTRQMTREDARRRARRLEDRLGEETLDEVQRARLEAERKRLREYGFRGVDDQPPGPSFDPEPGFRITELEDEILTLRRREEALRAEGRLLPNEDQNRLGEALLELQRLEAERSMGPPSPAQTQAQLFPEPIGPPASGVLPPEAVDHENAARLRALANMARGRAQAAAQRGASDANLGALAANYEVRAAAASARTPPGSSPNAWGVPPNPDLAARLEDAATVRENARQPAYQQRLMSPEQLPFPQEGVDITIRPEEPVYSSVIPPSGAAGFDYRVEPPMPRAPDEAAAQLEALRAAQPSSPEERRFIADRIALLESFPPAPRTAPPGMEAVSRIDPGTQAVMRPSADTVRLNWRQTLEGDAAYGRLKARSDQAQESADRIRETLRNNPLDEAKRAELTKRLAEEERKIGRHEELAQWRLARQAMEEAAGPRERALLADLAKGSKPDKSKLSQRGVSKRTEPTGLGSSPRAKLDSWRAQLAEMQARLLDARETGAAPERLQGLESTVAQLAERTRAAEADVIRLGAETTMRQQADLRKAASQAPQQPPSKPPDDPGPPRPDASEPPAAPARGMTPGATARGLLYDIEYNVRHAADRLEDPAAREKAGKIAGEIADRMSEYVARATVNAARAVDGVLHVNGDKRNGLAALSDADGVNLFDVLERRAAPTNERVARVAEAVQRAFDDMANRAEELGVKVWDQDAKAWRDFVRRLDYAPHLRPSIRALEADRGARTRVIGYMRSRGLSEADANAMLRDWIAINKTGKAGEESILARYLRDTGQAKTPKEAAKLLERYAKPGVRRSSSLEYSRGLDLPIVDPDLRQSLPGWIQHNWERLTWIEKFGQDLADDKVIGEAPRPRRLADAPGAAEQRNYEVLDTLGELLSELEKAGGSHLSDDVTKRLNSALGNFTENEFGRALSMAARQLGTFRLGYLGPANVFQGPLGSILRGDLSSTLKALGKTFDAEAIRAARQSGALRDSHDVLFGGDTQTSGTLATAVQAFLDWSGVNATESFNRVLTSNAGLEHIRELQRVARSGKEAVELPLGWRKDDVASARESLKRLGLPLERDPTAEELLEAMFRFDRDINFNTNPWHRPELVNSWFGKMATQFFNWSYQQTRLIHTEAFQRVANGFRNRDLNDLGRGVRNFLVLATLYPAAGILARLMRAAMKDAVPLAAAGMGLDSDLEADRWEDFWETGPAGQYVRGGLLMGAAPMPLGDFAESFLATGRPPEYSLLGAGAGSAGELILPVLTTYGRYLQDEFPEADIEDLVTDLGPPIPFVDMGGVHKAAFGGLLEGAAKAGPFGENVKDLISPLTDYLRDR